ncbi:hypothetical protein SASPL_150607 [Salvia splendens]|uniref:DRBM domain-containing protein n=1 Tax=Salvia splendens TaxID=180675 RepID=A0A8X8W721_SALSN|nr:hypothetical protein SASPL_150607 [Salvia splendens]
MAFSIGRQQSIRLLEFPSWHSPNTKILVVGPPNLWLLQELAPRLYSKGEQCCFYVYELLGTERRKLSMFSYVVAIGSTEYIGASACTKKEAEINAARTTLLAIETLVPVTEDHTGNIQETKEKGLMVRSDVTPLSLGIRVNGGENHKI